MGRVGSIVVRNPDGRGGLGRVGKRIGSADLGQRGRRMCSRVRRTGGRDGLVHPNLRPPHAVLTAPHGIPPSHGKQPVVAAVRERRGGGGGAGRGLRGVQSGQFDRYLVAAAPPELDRYRAILPVGRSNSSIGGLDRRAEFVPSPESEIGSSLNGSSPNNEIGQPGGRAAEVILGRGLHRRGRRLVDVQCHLAQIPFQTAAGPPARGRLRTRNRNLLLDDATVDHRGRKEQQRAVVLGNLRQRSQRGDVCLASDEGLLM
mmetsp:Transcript_18260/g.43960  ORF Transcript_18260/g.43960 Transcript_18260/m.43960 type:complete len:259 (-) Transcript_18260:731-1507(-)